MEAIKIRGRAATLIAEFDLISPCIMGSSTVLFFRTRCGSLSRIRIDGEVCERLEWRLSSIIVRVVAYISVFTSIIVIGISVDSESKVCCRH